MSAESTHGLFLTARILCAGRPDDGRLSDCCSIKGRFFLDWTMNLGSIVISVVYIAVAFGLVFWAVRAEKDRSARVGLYLVFGIPGVLLTVLGLALIANGMDKRFVALSVGLGLVAPLVRSVRVQLAKISPFDPQSAIDMSGLCVALAITAFLATSAEPTPSVSDAALISQVVLFVALAYTAVGVGISRTFKQATLRLGIERPTPKSFAVGLGFVGLSLVISAIASGATAALQPDVSDKIQQTLQNMTSDVQNPFGAVLLGLCAAIGEEVFFRGALQARFGIIVTSLIFAALHTQYGFSITTLGILGIGVLLGYERKKYGLSASIVTHAVFNILSVLALTYT